MSLFNKMEITMSKNMSLSNKMRITMSKNMSFSHSVNDDDHSEEEPAKEMPPPRRTIAQHEKDNYEKYDTENALGRGQLRRRKR